MDDLPPPPIDAHEPPPRKRGLGRGLADLRSTGHRTINGEQWTAFDFLTRGMVRADAARVAERTPQPVALHRLPEPADTGPLQLADIVAAAATTEKPRRLSESAAILNRALEHPSEAIRVQEPVVAAEPVEARGGLRASLAALDELEF